ncbi:branched-chain amino acid aminotransferase [Kribbella shirazensis]|uniref:Branched-chain-amino-acid aminotransferase n=1 Tax=Kribbella shirazensis TaxID=1105143 RepID=A0A7X5VI61_9ACTN|nr:branched-chain amino acid aminotransferase [Kribbella shirazensis]NIK61514.1 branched-chain amino acid aminotransferase [Kribbella shirazensis]
MFTTASSPAGESSHDPGLGFGRVFTDHLTSMSWTTDGWERPQVRPFHNLSLSPATMVLHYGQAIFEGLKAYPHPDGEIRLFRPELNARRFQLSADRMAMPELPVDDFLDCVSLLVSTDRSQVPDRPGHSLYLRPLMIATEATLGTRPAEEYLFLVIGSPSGPYFNGASPAITVWVSEDLPRAHPGGTGNAKCAGNYAAGMAVQRTAAEHGADQVVFLDAHEHRYLEELGGMNLFLVRQDSRGTTLVTPPLSDTILHGITRASLLTLAADLGLEVEERPITLAEWRDGSDDGSVTESFACGTAAVVTPIGRVRTSAGEFVIGDGTPGEWSARLRTELLAIQEGTTPDRHGWMRVVS